MSYPNIIVHPPQKRKDHFLSQISDEHKRKVRCKISGAAWIHLHPVEGDGHVLRLYLPEDCEAKHFLSSLDEQILEQTSDNNERWFPNALNEDKLRAYFRPSVPTAAASILGVYVSTWKDPVVYLNGTVVDSVQDLLHVPKNARVRAEIEPIGVCFFRQKFGVRWVLRKAWIHTHPIEEADGTVDGWDERETVEEAWTQELADMKLLIEKERDALLARAASLDDKYQCLSDLLEHAKQAQDPRIWNEQLENLSKTLSKYRSGAVTPLE